MKTFDKNIETLDIEAYLRSLHLVQDENHFRGWRSSFLSRFNDFLHEKAIITAEERYQTLDRLVLNLMKLIVRTKKLLADKDLTPERCSVKARNCLSELSKHIAAVMNEQDALMPRTVKMEDEYGYTKFHIGALLVRNSFEDYRKMSLCASGLNHLREELQLIANRQLMQEMEMFGIKFRMFCDLMTDIGLHYERKSNNNKKKKNKNKKNKKTNDTGSASTSEETEDASVATTEGPFLRLLRDNYIEIEFDPAMFCRAGRSDDDDFSWSDFSYDSLLLPGLQSKKIKRRRNRYPENTVIPEDGVPTLEEASLKDQDTSTDEEDSSSSSNEQLPRNRRPSQMRPSMTRGMSSDGLGCEEQEENQQSTETLPRNRRPSHMRPSMTRGMSSDSLGCEEQEENQESTETLPRNRRPSRMRPSMTRGMSSDGLGCEEQEENQESTETLPRNRRPSNMRPSMMRGMSAEDLVNESNVANSVADETSIENLPRSRRPSNMRPSMMRGMSSEGLDNEPVPTNQSPSRPSMFRGLSFDRSWQNFDSFPGSNSSSNANSPMDASSHTLDSKITLSPSLGNIDLPMPQDETQQKGDEEKMKGPDKAETKKNKMEDVPLIPVEVAREIFVWYARMGQPKLKDLKRRIGGVAAHISTDDIDKLPWNEKGRLNVRRMTNLYL